MCRNRPKHCKKSRWWHVEGFSGLGRDEQTFLFSTFSSSNNPVQGHWKRKTKLRNRKFLNWSGVNFQIPWSQTYKSDGGVMWHPCRRFAGDLQVKREEIVGSSMPVDNHVYGKILTKKYFIVSTVLYSTRSSLLCYSGYLAFCEYKMDQKWISVLGLFQLGLVILRGNNSGFLNNSS